MIVITKYLLVIIKGVGWMPEAASWSRDCAK